MYDEIMKSLIDIGVLNPNGTTINPHYKRLLGVFSGTKEELLSVTSFLYKRAPLRVRLQCVIRNIQYQPHCVGCGKELLMALTGERRFTFATSCNSKCFALRKET